MKVHKIDHSHHLQFSLIRIAFLDHLKFWHVKFIFVVLLLVVGSLLKLSLDFCRVNVRVEIRHEWEDDTHHQQERSKQDVLGPLWKMRREEMQKCYRWICLCPSWLLACCETDMMGAHENLPVWEALQFQPQSAQWSCQQQQSVASPPAALLSCYWEPWRHMKRGQKWKRRKCMWII